MRVTPTAAARSWLILAIGISAQFVEAQGSSGAFNTSVPITVPSYRGLEPSLSLSYSSSGGNGTVGAGWFLTGFSTIERYQRRGRRACL